MAMCYNIVIAALLSLNVVLNLEYNRCFIEWGRLFFNYKNFNKSLHYKIILSNQNELLENNCTQEDSEISCQTLTVSTYFGILKGKNIFKYNITVLAENTTVLLFPFTFDQCHILACEGIISVAEIKKIQKLDDRELSVKYEMTRSAVSATNISGYIESTDQSNVSKQISHLDKNTLNQPGVLNEKKITIKSICADYKLCLITSWQACIKDKKVNKTFPDCKVIYRKESSTNVDVQCHLYPREKRVQAMFMSSDVTKEFELSVSGIKTRHATNESSISIRFATENIKNVSLTPCTKCSCSKKKKVRCIEDKVTRGKNPVNIWYMVIAAVITPVVVTVLIALFCRRQELIKKTRQKKQGETVEPREPVNEYTEILDKVNEYTEILDKHSYDKVVISENVGGDDKMNEKKIVS